NPNSFRRRSSCMRRRVPYPWSRRRDGRRRWRAPPRAKAGKEFSRRRRRRARFHQVEDRQEKFRLLRARDGVLPVENVAWHGGDADASRLLFLVEDRVALVVAVEELRGLGEIEPVLADDRRARASARGGSGGARRACWVGARSCRKRNRCRPICRYRPPPRVVP